MFTARKKIAKEKGAEPDDFEESVAQVGERASDFEQNCMALMQPFGQGVGGYLG